jgi:hypothetical protein
VWDHTLRNIEKWKAMNRLHAPSHVPLGYVPELSRIKASQAQDIDVLFYGSLNERRTAILNALKNAGLKVHTVFGVYGEQRDESIARCKVVLNIHFYETRVFEFVRIAYLLANSKAGQRMLLGKRNGASYQRRLRKRLLTDAEKKQVLGYLKCPDRRADRRAGTASMAHSMPTSLVQILPRVSLI